MVVGDEEEGEAKASAGARGKAGGNVDINAEEQERLLQQVCPDQVRCVAADQVTCAAADQASCVAGAGLP